MALLIRKYDTLSEYLDTAAQGGYRLRNLKWAGGRSLREAIAYVRRGEEANSRAMREARELLDKIDSSFRDRDAMQWLPSVAGAYPVVPEYLMGLPDNMRERLSVEDDRAPVRILMEPVVSAGLSERETMRRGVAVCALAMRMAEERPVELYAFEGMAPSGWNPVLSMTRIATDPLNLAQAIAVWGSLSFARQVTFNHLSAVTGRSGNVHIAWLFGYPGPDREKEIRKALELAPQDVVIQGGFLPDAELMDSNPVEWVHKQLEKQRRIDI